MKKIVGLLIAFCMLITVLPLSASAAGSGTCGANLIWSLSDSGMLTIRGTGDMYDYDCDSVGRSTAPWSSQSHLIQSVVISSGVTTIGKYAFSDCGRLEQVTLPQGLVEIGERAFNGCYSLTQISLPTSLRQIGEYAFCSSGLIGMELPEGLLAVEEAAFLYCENLKSVSIPSSLEYLAVFTFEGCSNLERFDVEEGSRYFCSINGVLYDSWVEILINYPPAKPETAYSVPDTVTILGSGSLYRCNNIQTLTIPDSVTIMGDYVFDHYGRTAPLSIRYTGSQAQWQRIMLSGGADALNDAVIYFDDMQPDIVSHKVTNGSISFDKTTGTVLSADKTVTEVTIPDAISGVSVQKIGAAAFRDCTALTSVTLPDGITELGGYAFYGCSALTQINIPVSVTIIGEKTFYDCRSLKSVAFPDSLEAIGDSAFQNCTSLTDIRLSEGLQTLGYQVFMGCQNVQFMSFPSGVTYITKRTATNCSSLKAVYIPASVSWIGCYAFQGCSDLLEVFYEGYDFQWDSIVFLDVSDQHVLEGANVRYGASFSEFEAFVSQTGTEDGPSVPSDTVTLQIQGTADYQEAFAVLEKLNELRISQGLQPLTMDQSLLESAMQRAAEQTIFYGHDRPDGQPFITSVSLPYTITGENIAAGQAHAQQVMTDWTNSPGHYANMIDPRYTAVGIGCFYQPNGNKCWAQLFTGGADTTPAVPTEAQNEIFTIRASKDNLQLTLSPATATLKLGQSAGFVLKNAINNGVDFLASSVILPSYCVADNPSVVTVASHSNIVGAAPGSTTVRIGVDENTYAVATVVVEGGTVEAPSSWAQKEVNAAIGAALVPTKLQQNYVKPVSRLDVAQMVINLIEQSSGKSIEQVMAEKNVSINPNAFTDTSDDAVLAANALGIINGVGNNKFDPNGAFTRAHVVAIINRVAKVLEVDTNGYTHNFTDVSGHWVDAELGWPVHAGIINGVSSNSFDPQGALTTEQAIIVTYRALQALNNA